MRHQHNTLFERVRGDKSTPLKEVTDAKLREKNLLFKQLGSQLKIKDSQLKRILAGESGTKPETIRAFHNFLEIDSACWEILWDERTNRARSFDAFSQLLEQNSLTTDTKSGPQARVGKNNKPIILIAFTCLIVCYGLWHSFSNAKTKQAPALINSERPCLVELREKTLPEFDCKEFGIFSVSGSSLEQWNTKTSLIYVPRDWVVIARYETWGGQNYSVLQEEKSGFVKLDTGFNHLGTDTYDVFDNQSLQGSSRRSTERELNDRLQYLVVTQATSKEEMKVWEHDEKSDPNQIEISFEAH